jgi:hypothetical protein
MSSDSPSAKAAAAFDADEGFLVLKPALVVGMRGVPDHGGETQVAAA